MNELLLRKIGLRSINFRLFWTDESEILYPRQEDVAGVYRSRCISSLFDGTWPGWNAGVSGLQ